MANVQGERLLRVDEAAAALGLRPGTVRRWILHRTIAFVRVGPRAIRIPQSVIDGVVARGTVPACGADDNDTPAGEATRQVRA